jgi:hypothetical protein
MFTGGGIKEGVKLEGLAPQMVLAFVIAQTVYSDRGFPCIVTSGSDGAHQSDSLHYMGKALDIRLPSWYGAQYKSQDQLVFDAIYKSLNAPLLYDVVYEADHIHVEYQPKFKGIA